MWLRKSRKEPVLSHISMKNLPESERPYERFQILGAEALSDAELLAIILKTGAKDYTAESSMEEPCTKAPAAIITSQS